MGLGREHRKKRGLAREYHNPKHNEQMHLVPHANTLVNVPQYPTLPLPPGGTMNNMMQYPFPANQQPGTQMLIPPYPIPATQPVGNMNNGLPLYPASPYQQGMTPMQGWYDRGYAH